MCRRPVLRAMTNIDKKVMKDLFPFDRMIYFRMELKPIEYLFTFFFVPEGSYGNAIRSGEQLKIAGQLQDRIGVAHPDLGGGYQIREQPVFLFNMQDSPAIFALIAFF